MATLGAQALTLDAVYKQAGISKGGLLYHFPTKESLIDGMIARYFERSMENEARLRRNLPSNTPGDTTRRLAVAQLAAEDASTDRLGVALLAAVANDLERLAPLRSAVLRQFLEMRDSPLGFERAAIVELATIGITFMELLRLRPLGEDDRDRVLRELDRLAGGDGTILKAE